MVKGVRFVAGLGVAHLPNHLTAERVHHVKRLAAVLPEDAADAVLVHEPRHMCDDDVPFWGQGAVVARIPRHPKGRARPLSSVFSSSLSSPSAPLPVTRRVPLLTSASGAMTQLWRRTKSVASTSPCISLILSLMYASMAA